MPTARHHVALPHKTAVAADALIWLVKTESHLWKQFAAPVLNDADQLTYFIGIQKDVTARVEAERRVKELEQELDALRAAT